MKERILSGWNFVRVLWLLMGVGIVTQAITEKNLLMLIPGIYFVFAALANIGCFAGTCASSNPGDTKSKVPVTEVEFEEVQSKK